MFANFCKAALALMLVTLCALVAYQVFARYLPMVPPFLWTEEIARTVFMWMIMLGTAWGFVGGTHFRFTFVQEQLTRRFGRWPGLLAETLTLLVMTFFLFSSWSFFLKGFNRSSLVTGLPSATSYGALFVGAAISVLAIAWALWQTLRGSGPHEKAR
ncbi:TRAP transporter small permease subunit [Sulfitobacter sp. D35]|uniref:TRAP transporter small permease n=1 Tax=Sulfitobacter sp. D35 TaxID=3083252 RepID=UPI00296FEE8E|nr:TRAP transporter small permease subunit [Sulfitobacter sp. D35]MDW4499944.1 TRAP transporter small permease subunit [Sulfitobacter sp. D35]